MFCTVWRRSRGFRSLGIRFFILGIGVVTQSPGKLPAQPCVACTITAECGYVPTSGSCSCAAKVTSRGFRVCKLAGDCNPRDVKICPSEPDQRIGGTARVHPAGLLLLEEEDSLIGAVVRGAVEQSVDSGGWSTGSLLAFGVHEGTVKASDEDVGYRYRVALTQAEIGRLELRGTLTSAAGDVIEFRGDLLEGGRSGRIVIRRDGGPGPARRVLSWPQRE